MALSRATHSKCIIKWFCPRGDWIGKSSRRALAEGGGGAMDALTKPIQIAKILKQQTITLFEMSKLIIIAGIPVQYFVVLLLAQC